jgi:hypothetical protein
MCACKTEILRTTLSSFYVGSRLAQRAPSSNPPPSAVKNLSSIGDEPAEGKTKQFTAKGGEEHPRQDQSLRRSKRENTWILDEEESDPTRGRKPLSDVEAEDVRVCALHNIISSFSFPSPPFLISSLCNSYALMRINLQCNMI